MGRKKLQLGLIQDKKKRDLTFKNRMMNLKKKAYEFSTLCDVPVCVIVYNGPNSEPEIYPENEEKVRGVMDRYFSITKKERSKRFEILDEINSKRRKLDDDTLLNGYSREELAILGSQLDYKLHCLKERVEKVGLQGKAVGSDNLGVSDYPDLGFEKVGLQGKAISSDDLGVSDYPNLEFEKVGLQGKANSSNDMGVSDHPDVGFDRVGLQGKASSSNDMGVSDYPDAGFDRVGLQGKTNSSDDWGEDVEFDIDELLTALYWDASAEIDLSECEASDYTPQMDLSEYDASDFTPQIDLSECDASDYTPQIDLSECDASDFTPQTNLSECDASDFTPQTYLSECDASGYTPQIDLSDCDASGYTPQIDLSECDASLPDASLPEFAGKNLVEIWYPETSFVWQ